VLINKYYSRTSVIFKSYLVFCLSLFLGLDWW